MDALSLEELPSFVADVLPSATLAESLIDLYFVKSNDILPILHRPTFEFHWRRGLHTWNIWFAAVALSIFGVASRWSDDPRVLPVGSETSPSDKDEFWALAGMKYIEAALGKRNLRAFATALQLCCF